ncbi:hypothetical protein [Marinomonas sp. PE14-40]|uniref:hypothetical protein n=1 Tax=Marinomonas sp. PE14-40 TaxID=3060621 RepID=UPI003F6683B3
MSEPMNNELFASQNEPSSINYVLTSKRYLLRILDIGLITPELVVCNENGEIQVVKSEELPGILTIEEGPMVPVLLELKTSGNMHGAVIPAAAIAVIHFPSNDDCEDYLSRAFENVPNELFKLEATPELFLPGSCLSSNLIFPKLDKQALSEKYRKADVFAGVLLHYLAQGKNADSLKSNIEKLAGKPTTNLFSADTIQLLMTQSLDITIEESISTVLEHYLKVLSSHPVDTGWNAKEVLQALDSLQGKKSPEDLFKKWIDFSYEIISNDRDLIPLTDEKQIVLRAILLHLLNPDQDSINRMAVREPLLGGKVISIARYLATAREGFSTISSEKKREVSGVYFLISSLISAGINNPQLSLEELKVVDESETELLLSWGNEIADRNTENKAVNNKTNIEESSAPEYGADSKQDDAQFIETNIEESINDIDSENVIDREKLSDLSNEIKTVIGVTVEDEVLALDLDKKLLKLKTISIPKHANFTLQIEGDNLIFETRLLDLTIVSHTKKLTGPKMRAMLEYQTEMGRDFNFNLVPDESLRATIRFSSTNLDSLRVEKILNQLIDVQIWMKS